MRFLLDEMFPPVAARRLRERGHDAVHVEDRNLHRRPDHEVAAAARGEGRVLVTENVRHFADEDAMVVACVLKSRLPRQGMDVHLADRLDKWARSCADPVPGLYWP